MKTTTSRIVGPAILVLALATGLSLAGGPAKTAFVPMGDHDLVPMDITADGSKILGIGYFGAPHFTWTRDGGYVLMGGGCGSGQPSMSADGSVIVGCTIDEFGRQVSAVWAGGTDWTILESIEGAVPCDAFFHSTWDVDDAGTTAVGLGWLPQQCRAHAASWDLVAGGPATDLGSLYENNASRANAISGNGQVIVGWQDADFGRQGAQWVDGVESLILTPSGEGVGEVLDVNSDGSVMVGISYPIGSSDGWVWTAKSGFKAISGNQFFSQIVPVAASDDGSVVVGIARSQNNGQKAFIYQKGKLTWADDYLAKKRLAAGWQIASLSVISPDGRTLAGWGINPDGMIEGFLIDNF